VLDLVLCWHNFTPSYRFIYVSRFGYPPMIHRTGTAGAAVSVRWGVAVVLLARGAIVARDRTETGNDHRPARE
jgi:hypothetical protein